MKRIIPGKLILCEGDKRCHIRGLGVLETLCGRKRVVKVEVKDSGVNSYSMMGCYKGEKPVCRQCAKVIIRAAEEAIEKYDEAHGRAEAALMNMTALTNFMPKLLILTKESKKE